MDVVQSSGHSVVSQELVIDPHVKLDNIHSL